MTKERAEKIIEKNIDMSVREYQHQDAEYEDGITEDDVKSWGYDSLDDFWESHI